MSILSTPERIVTSRNKFNKVAANKDNVFVSDDNGITETMANGGWRFTPASEIENITIDVQGPYETPPIPSAPARLPVEAFNNPTPAVDAETQDTTKATYFFGIDEISSYYRMTNKTCGVIFKSITTGRCSYIELVADTVTNDNCSVEFYIVDGTKETPILPLSCERVVNEKLFFNMNPRFSVDTKKDIEIKKNGEIIKRTTDGLENLDLSDGLYTISYTPTNAYQYYPENDTINVKAIQRLYNEDAEPSYVTNVLIRKYGGGIPWTE